MFKDFATPTRINRISFDEELLNLVNLYNGRTNVYMSLYWYSVESTDEYNNEIRQAHIDKIFFDIDGDLESARKLAKYLLEKDFKFRMFHSGNGYHFYVFSTGEGNASNLRIAQLAILQEAGASADMHVIGDVQRVSRVPNTYNFKSQSFCVPLSIEDLGTERERGVTQRFEKIAYGTKLLDLLSYTEEHYNYLKPEIVPNLHISGDILLIPCMKNIISTLNPRHDQRFLLAVYLSFAVRNGKDIYNFNSKDIITKVMEFMKMNCTHWLDFSESKTSYYLNNIIPKFNPRVSCRFIRAKGCCIECGLKEREL